MEIPKEGMRLNKYLAHCGICSRRQAIDFIRSGKVKVNGVVEKEPGFLLEPGQEVHYNDKPINLEERKVYLLLNKPKNVITTLSDDRGRRTVMDLIGDEIKERIFPVGRLDRATTGLLLLTNDGDLAQKLAHPSHGVKKLYHVQLDKPVTEQHIQQIRQGLTLEDGPVRVDTVKRAQGKAANEIMIELHLGRNRIVRRIFESLGYQVNRLDRVIYAGLTKKDLPRGRYRKLTEMELVMLRHFS